MSHELVTTNESLETRDTVNGVSCLDLTPREVVNMPCLALNSTEPRSVELSAPLIDTPEPHTPNAETTTAEPKWSYFITMNVSPKEHVFAVHYDTNRRKAIRKTYKWLELTQAEQYSYFHYSLGKFTDMLLFNDNSSQYYFWFEQCKSGDVHLHGLLKTETFSCIKDLKLFILEKFQLKINLKNAKYLIDVKKFDYKLWNNYQNKTSIKKIDSKTDFKPIFNYDINK